MTQIYTVVGLYEEAAMRTAKDMGSVKMNLIHAALGLTSDAGEFATAIKSSEIYNKPLDFENVVEELGDCLWFIALACKTIGTTMGEVMSANIEKLAMRYPDKYSDEAAIARADKSEHVLNVKFTEDNKTQVDVINPKQNYWRISRNHTDAMNGVYFPGIYSSLDSATANALSGTHYVSEHTPETY